MISSKQRAFLKKEAHHLKASLNVGKDGIDENSLKAIDELLEAHELVKVKILKNNLDNRSELIDVILDSLDAEFVQYIGNILTLYRGREDGKIQLP